VPTTYVWGTSDPALGRAAAERTARYVSADYRFVEVAAGHWLPETCPERVAEEVLARVG
jgi:pimeloyl-ACP methyl ester carboxylesterase